MSFAEKLDCRRTYVQLAAIALRSLQMQPTMMILQCAFVAIVMLVCESASLAAPCRTSARRGGPICDASRRDAARRLIYFWNTIATWLTLSQVYPYYGATLITPLLKLCNTCTCAINFWNKISMTKVSMLWGQFINNLVTHNAYYYAQTLRFALALILLQSCLLELDFVGGWSKRIRYILTEAFGSGNRVIRENRVFWLSRWLLAPVGAELVPRVGYFARAGCESWLWELGRGSDSQFGIG